MCNTVFFNIYIYTGFCKSPVTLYNFLFKVLRISQKRNIDTKTISSSFIITFTTYLLNVTTFGIDNPIQTGSKPLTNPTHIFFPH